MLEDKLQEVLDGNERLKDKFGQAPNRGIELLDCLIDHIAERLRIGDKWESTLQLVKQTDTIWRSFAKKMGFRQDFFRNYYIIPRLYDKPYAMEYFKMTKEEIDKYGKK